jgi:Cu2+-exporting ATPase
MRAVVGPTAPRRDDGGTHDHGVTVVLEVGGVRWGTSKAVAEAVLSRRAGVLAAEVNPVAQTATVRFDAGVTSVAELTGWVRGCGYHCSGQSIPQHLCDPLTEPVRATRAEHEPAKAPTGMTPQEAIGHGGHHAGMSMDAMVRDMRNRFLVAAVLSVPILVFSPIGRDVLGFRGAAPFGIRDELPRCFRTPDYWRFQTAVGFP